MLLDLAARALLMPVLLGQAVYLRRSVITLPEPSGARSGVLGDGAPLRLLVIGDSSAVGVGVETQADALTGQVTTQLAGEGAIAFDLVAKVGAKTSDVLTWLDDLPQDRYDVVVTALGVNDVTKGVSLRRWLRLQRQLLDRLQTNFGAELILVSGLPPMHQFPLLPHPLRWVLGRQAVRFDRNLRDLVAQRADCVFVTVDLGLDDTNMAGDGFHPGPVVYAAWAKEVVQHIRSHPHLLDGANVTP
jgi:lysophospholipase L1-like esterase